MCGQKILMFIISPVAEKSVPFKVIHFVLKLNHLK